MARPIQIVVACDDPARLAAFWQEALGYAPEDPPAGFDTWEAFADAFGIPEERRNDLDSAVDPDGVGPRILFERWDAGAPQQRIHLDITVMGRAGGSLEERKARLGEERVRLEDLGATFEREATGMAGEYWIEMFDPEGNWFCVQ